MLISAGIAFSFLPCSTAGTATVTVRAGGRKRRSGLFVAEDRSHVRQVPHKRALGRIYRRIRPGQFPRIRSLFRSG